MDRINNYITDLESRRDFAGAQSAALAAAAELPSEPKLAELARAASYNKAIAIAQSGDWAAAFEAAVGDAAAWPGDARLPRSSPPAFLRWLRPTPVKATSRAPAQL